MMEDHLRTPEAWRRWLALLARHPGQEAEIDARASLLAERYEADFPVEQAVSLAIERTDLVQEALALQEGAASRREAPRWGWRAAAVGVALAAGLAVGVLLPRAGERDVTWRGEAPGAAQALAWGTLEIEQARRGLGRVAVGRGVRPVVALGEGPVVVRWNVADPPPGFGAWAYLADAAGRPLDDPTPISGYATVAVRAGAAALVVLVLPAAEDPVAVAAVVGDGRREVEPLGAVQVVAFDLR